MRENPHNAHNKWRCRRRGRKHQKMVVSCTRLAVRRARCVVPGEIVCHGGEKAGAPMASRGPAFHASHKASTRVEMSWRCAKCLAEAATARHNHGDMRVK